MAEIIKNNTTDTSFSLLPNFCDVKNVFILILLAEILAFVFTLAGADKNDFWNYLARASFAILWIALLNASLLCLLKNKLQQLTAIPYLVISFFIMLSTSFFVALLIHQVSTSFIYSDTTAFDFVFILRIVSISAIVYSIVLRYFYVQYQWRHNLAVNTQAEIQALQARIRPHFLFNSLNTIASLISYAPQNAESAIENLSDLFRASLSEQTLCTLADEITLTKSYFAIESLRLDARLTVQWEVDPALLTTNVPSLFIQPLAENAVYHGIEPLPKGGKITLSALQVDNKLCFSISNPLLASTTKPVQRKGHKIALDNVKRRFELVYGNNSKLKINETKDNYTVSVTIPLDLKDECDYC